MADIGFEFPIDFSGQWDGFNDPGIEHFTGNPFQHLGREVPQNTMDAKLGDPARITVRLLKVPMAELPAAGELRQAVQSCATAAKGENSEKAVKFFAEADRLLGKKDITVLQIADTNTTGVLGPCENGRPFFAMLKATGQSKKAGTSTGSYGIGKFAPYTVSALRTVFLTTVWKDDAGAWHHYVQGKSILMSHYDAKGATRRGTGFWGVREKCMPLQKLDPVIPDWLRRTDDTGSFAGQSGTTLSIVGFVAAKGWQDVLAANIVENFFGAIARGELEVAIENSHLITQATLADLLADPALSASIKEQENEPEKFANVSSYLQALGNGEEVIVAETENFYLGKCELRILLGENLPKKVAVLRNGMLITEGLPGLKRFSDFKEFVAVLECKSAKGLALLRAMEPPRHDAFEPDRLPPDQRSAGRTALRELAEWVRKMLQRHAQDETSEKTNLDELADFFADEDDEGKTKQKDENPAGAIVIRARPVKSKAPGGAVGSIEASDADDADGDGDGTGDGGGTGDGTGGSGGGKNDGTGGDKDGSDGGASAGRRALSAGLPLKDVRAVPLSLKRRRVAFTPITSGTVLVELQDSGADTNYALKVVGTSAGTVNNGQVHGLTVVAGKRFSIEVELDSEFEGTMRVVADAI
jgi:hypothetical protein